MLNEQNQLFSFFLYRGVFTEGFFWVAQERGKAHPMEVSVGSQAGNVASKVKIRLGETRAGKKRVMSKTG